LNPEFNMNGLDAGGKEDYKLSREPSGVTKQYYCKLLLTNFGGNATTFIHQPITFNPPLNRLIDLRFQWLDSDGNIINNNDSEWNMIINITEQTDVSSIPRNMPFPLAQISESAPAAAGPAPATPPAQGNAK